MVHWGTKQHVKHKPDVKYDAGQGALIPRKSSNSESVRWDTHMLDWCLCVCVCVYTLERSPTSSHPFVPVNLWLLNQSRASGQLKLPTGKHSKRLPSMNIYPEVLGEIPQHHYSLSLHVCLPLPSQRAVSGFVSTHKSSLPTPLPRSPHCESFNLVCLFQRHIKSQDTACLEFNRGIDGSLLFITFMKAGVWSFSFKLREVS